MTPDIEAVELTSGRMRVRLLSLGAITQGWWLDGTPLILGYSSPSDYLTDPYYMGAIVGPVANRVGGTTHSFRGNDLDLTRNEDHAVLHSGPTGLSRQHWTMTQLNAKSVRLTHDAAHGQAGFPGPVAFEILVSLTHDKLVYDMKAFSDRPTPVSLAQHNYYTLGEPSAARLRLELAASRVLDLSDDGTASGGTTGVAEGALDFSRPRNLGDASRDLDRYFIFDQTPQDVRSVAELEASSGLRLRISSDQPGAQVYVGHALSAPFSPGAGVCVEPSGYPNALNHAHFPSIDCTAARPYRQRLVLELVE